MENNSTETQETIQVSQKAKNFALKMIEGGSSKKAIIAKLTNGYGLSPEQAQETFQEIKSVFDEAFLKNAQKDLVMGLLICAVGVVLTVAEIGYVFWGAILYGGYQFIKGLMNYVKASKKKA